MLYALGSNGSGQLGVGHTNDLSIPEPIGVPDNQSSWTVEQLAAGGNHTLILCSDGKLRATGNNEDGRCGIRGLKHTTQFTEVELPVAEDGTPVITKQISAGWSSTTLLSTDGSVYTCGTGNSGELGLGPGVKHAPSLQRIPDFPPPGKVVVFVASGMAHTVAVSSDHTVYGWGKGRKGQLGGLGKDVWSPRRVADVDFDVTEAACGKDFTIVGQPATGRHMLLGPGGNDRFGIRHSQPILLPGWKQLSASWGSIYALNALGGLVAWGRDDHGQLPREGLPKMEGVAAGSEHCLGLTNAGMALAWGWGEHGNCGTPTDEEGDVKHSWNEISLPRRVIKVFAGCATSFFETEKQDSMDE